MKRQVANWLNSAQYDLEVARHMYESGRYIYTIFFCHLALEKALKAKAQEVTGKLPPKTHNLRYLLKLCGLEVADDVFEFLSKLSDVSVPTRYPEDFGKILAAYNKRAVSEYVDKTNEVFEWIKKSLKP